MKIPSVAKRNFFLAIALHVLIIWYSQARTLASSKAGNELVFHPKHEVLEGTEIVWQKPSQLRGVLLIAHGCSHSATDFWPQSANCPKCLGLPEEVNITRTALSRGYAVLAASSADRRRRCWRSSGAMMSASIMNPDVKNVKSMLAAWLVREGLADPNNVSRVVPGDPYQRATSAMARYIMRKAESRKPPRTVISAQVPLYGLGASSGGAFIMVLAMGSVRFAGVCSQVMALPSLVHVRYLRVQKTQDALPPLPPTMFVHMPRDARTASLVNLEMKFLKSKGVPVREVPILPSPLTPELLHTSCGSEISLDQSKAIYDVFRSSGLINAEGILIQDPRRSRWREILLKSPVPDVHEMRLEPDASPISEILNVLWAGHEIISRSTSDMLDFFERPAK